MHIYFYSLHVSGRSMPTIRRINFINTTSGMSLCIDDRLVCRFGWDCRCLFLFSTCFGQPCAHHQEN